MFRWDIPATTAALVAAQRRGARVEIVADADMRTKPAGRAVMKQIEAGEPGVRNVVVCRGACLPWRGTGPAPPSQDVNHLKLLLADVDGRRSVVTSSSNFEGRQYTQYNSLTRVFDDAFYDYGSEVLQEARRRRAGRSAGRPGPTGNGPSAVRLGPWSTHAEVTCSSRRSRRCAASRAPARSTS